ncbi:hypothetical protein E4T56_gene9095 [Termitomyces sp. T112]|nr:hypothetical protein C0989_002038 [Termitomyces sp. Mn162]KAG5715808.1 hypothetical protein E4T56_gene9095 [Termitomyces sp. T112]
MLTLHLIKSQTEPNSKPKLKMTKVLPVYANLKPGSDAMLMLLSQVNTTLEAIQLADNGTFLPHADLQQQCDVINLAAQQQLYALDIVLQTYKLILGYLDCFDKTLGPLDIN